MQEVRVGGVNVSIKAKWAVDFDEDACTTYMLNNPQSHVRGDTGEGEGTGGQGGTPGYLVAVCF